MPVNQTNWLHTSQMFLQATMRHALLSTNQHVGSQLNAEKSQSRWAQVLWWFIGRWNLWFINSLLSVTCPGRAPLHRPGPTRYAREKKKSWRRVVATRHNQAILGINHKPGLLSTTLKFLLRGAKTVPLPPPLLPKSGVVERGWNLAGATNDAHEYVPFLPSLWARRQRVQTHEWYFSASWFWRSKPLFLAFRSACNARTFPPRACSWIWK